ncbi:unnamed protein product [Gadus morhua 'NCC']
MNARQSRNEELGRRRRGRGEGDGRRGREEKEKRGVAIEISPWFSHHARLLCCGQAVSPEEQLSGASARPIVSALPIACPPLALLGPSHAFVSTNVLQEHQASPRVLGRWATGPQVCGPWDSTTSV